MRVIVGYPSYICEVEEGGRLWLVAYAYRRERVLAAELLRQDWWSWLTTQQRREYAMGFFERARKTDEAARQSGSLLDEDTRKRFPLLHEVMQARMPDKPGDNARMSLSIFSQEGVWKAILRDKADGLCLWVSSPVLGKLFAVLEASLASEETVWRLDRYSGNGEAARKKKGK